MNASHFYYKLKFSQTTEKISALTETDINFVRETTSIKTSKVSHDPYKI